MLMTLNLGHAATGVLKIFPVSAKKLRATNIQSLQNLVPIAPVMFLTWGSFRGVLLETF